MTALPPKVRRNNLLTLIFLVLFALGLCLAVLISMRIHAQRQGTTTYPPLPSTFQPPPDAAYPTTDQPLT